MMAKLFLWFYCLPIWQAVLLILSATAAFLLLREKYRNSPYWKPCIALLLCVWTAVILRGTHSRQSGGSLSEPVLVPFASYHAALAGGPREIYRTNFMNAALFYPAGLLGHELLPGWRRRFLKILPLTVLYALVSFGIEYTQFRFGLGVAETDDVIHNTLGTLLGAIACSACLKFPKQ